MPYPITAYGLSDVGLVRQNNEDVWREVPECKFFVLADGMGGHLAGEVAAEEAVNSLSNIIKRSLSRRKKKKSLAESRELIVRAIQETNIIVYRKSMETEAYHGMGTTLCILYIHEDGVILGHAGDSRIYRLRHGILDQLTRDDSLIMDLIDLGEVKENEIESYAHKNVITKSIGTEPFIDPTVEFNEIQPGDTYLMCTDGLTDLLKKNEMQTILEENPNLEKAAKLLVKKALEYGGTDNITVVLIHVEESK